ncbi:PREDICTED: uncharacterized protein LOC106804655 isoform X2 [Priapulus caudatus]|uniref:Uncharacterized protein LOC106804655 isoform X2 n=1 Tax=Priapulus caudatus TaxID=37621 RepID=A0ABM1DN91_PRICU|nr:PREDICTED: uncharacterized protein LOC106804655 isoform X2 [Priapulus caudatus]
MRIYALLVFLTAFGMYRTAPGLNEELLKELQAVSGSREDMRQLRERVQDLAARADPQEMSDGAGGQSEEASLMQELVEKLRENGLTNEEMKSVAGYLRSAAAAAPPRNSYVGERIDDEGLEPSNADDNIEAILKAQQGQFGKFDNSNAQGEQSPQALQQRSINSRGIEDRGLAQSGLDSADEAQTRRWLREYLEERHRDAASNAAEDANAKDDSALLKEILLARIRISALTHKLKVMDDLEGKLVELLAEAEDQGITIPDLLADLEYKKQQIEEAMRGDLEGIAM